MKGILLHCLSCSFRLLRVGRWVVLGALLPLHGQGQAPILSPQMLLNFTAMATGSDSQLRWTTTQEPSSLVSFSVERSQDGQRFQPLVVVPSRAGTSRNSYEWQDATVAGATGTWVYYRLRLLYSNGPETFSPVRAMRRPKALTPFMVFPTMLSDGTLHYQYDGILALNAVLEVSNSKGKLVWRQEASQGMTNCILLPQLPTGWYAVRLNENNKFYTSLFCQQ